MGDEKGIEQETQGLYSYFINRSMATPDDALVKMAIEDILKSGLLPKVLEKAQVKIFNGTKEELTKKLGFSSINNQSLTNFKLIEFPYLDENNKIILCRYKLIPSLYLSKTKEERLYSTKELKYIQPLKTPAMPYILPDIWEAKDQTNIPLWITEGEKKALKLFQHGKFAIAISGIWNFKAGKNSEYEDSKKLWTELLKFNLKSRLVYLAFDSDFKTNENIRMALLELAFKLYSIDAMVKIALWPEEKGIDDFLAIQDLSNNIPPEDSLKNIENWSQMLIDFISPSNTPVEEIARATALSGIEGIKYHQISRMVRDKFKISLITFKDEVKKQKNKIDATKDIKKENKEGIHLQKLCKLSYTPIIPEGFTIQDDYLCKIITVRDVDFNQCVSYAFAINSFIESKESKLLFKTSKGKEEVIDMSITNIDEFNRNFSNFLNSPLTKDDIKSLQKYVKDYYILNKHNLTMLKGLEETGWNNNIFYLPTRNFTNIVWTDETIVDTIKTLGNKKLQFETLRGILRMPAGVCLLAGLSTPLLRILNIPNYIVSLTGLPEKGKSSISWFNVSLWGNPLFLKGSWYSTKVGFEKFASMWKDMPVWLDELETKGKEVSDIIDFIYQYHEGFGKLRGSRDLKLRKRLEFRGVFFATSEKDLDSILSQVKYTRTIPRGIFRRVVEVIIDDNSFKGLDDKFELDPSVLNNFASENHGWVGAEWVEWIEKNIAEVKECFWSSYNKLKKAKHVKSMETSFAVLFTTSELLDKFLNMEIVNEEGERAGIYLRKWIKENLIGEQESKLSRMLNITEDALQALRDFVLINRDKFYGTLKDPKTGFLIDPRTLWGEIRETEFGKDVFILSSVFKDEFCRKYGFVERQVLRALNEERGENKEKFLKVQSMGKNRKTYQYKHYLLGQYVKGYYIEKLFENIIDEQNSRDEG